MKAFGLPIDEAELEKMTSDNRVMMILGQEPNRVDFLNFLTGINFQEAYSRRIHRRIGATEAPHICRNDLILTKKAIGRPRDLLDLESLDKSADQ